MGILSVPILRPNREAWIAAARRFKEALRTNPNMKVRFFATCTENMSGDSWTCDEVIVPLRQTIGGSGNAINEELIAQATDEQLRHPGAVKDYSALMWLDQQIAMGGVPSSESSVPWGWILGIAVVGGGWLAWRLAKNGSRGLGSGLEGTPFEHIARAAEQTIDAEAMERDNRPVQAYELYSYALEECSWIPHASDVPWPKFCFKAYDKVDKYRSIFSDPKRASKAAAAQRARDAYVRPQPIAYQRGRKRILDEKIRGR